MANGDQDYVRSQLLDALMEKVEDDPYPSNTMLDMIEELLEPNEVATYAGALLARIREDKFPSIPMLKRIQGLV